MIITDRPKLIAVRTARAAYAFNPTYEEISILGQIYQYQSGFQYNVLFGNTYFTGPQASLDYGWAAFPAWPGVTYRGSETHAAGAPQFEPATWTTCQAATGVPDFSPASQDIAALWLLRNGNGQLAEWGTTFAYNGAIYAFAAGTPE